MTHPHPLVCVHALGAGWTLEPDGPLPDGRDKGPHGEPGWALGWFVLGPTTRGNPDRAQASASLAFALDQGHCSDDAETRIPKAVLAKLDQIADALTEAGLW